MTTTRPERKGKRMTTDSTQGDTSAHKQMPNGPAPTECPCIACLAAADVKFWWMVVCDDCGNKRCPRARSHKNACTGSNDPGQRGSAYADTSPCSPEEFWGDEGTERAPLAPSEPDPAPVTVRTTAVPAAAQDGRTTERFDVADLRSCIDRLSKRALAAEAEVERLHETLWPDDMFRRTLVRAEVAEAEVETLKDRLRLECCTSIKSERDALRAKVARVEDVARFPRITTTAGGTSLVYVNHVDLRAALADPEPAQVQQADEVVDLPDGPCTICATGDPGRLHFCPDRGRKVGAL